MKILVTGGCGYKGHVLVPELLKLGHSVSVADTLWFGNYHKPHKNLNIYRADVCDISTVPLEGIDTVIHLASIANDPCGDLNPKLTWETSCLATMQIAEHSMRNGVKRLIYASSGSVYGVKEEEKVTEDLSLEPISEYNKTKMVSERVLKSYSKDMCVQIIRPATVCGLSPRMRLDVSVNMLTMQALTTGQITVFGGNQIRPNIHINDIISVYLHFLRNPDLTGIFNAGFENISILDIAKRIQKRIPCEIIITESNDPRSYRLDSQKLLDTGFEPKFGINDAIDEIIVAYRNGNLLDKKIAHNLNWMKQNKLATKVAA